MLLLDAVLNPRFQSNGCIELDSLALELAALRSAVMHREGVKVELHTLFVLVL